MKTPHRILIATATVLGGSLLAGVAHAQVLEQIVTSALQAPPTNTAVASEFATVVGTVCPQGQNTASLRVLNQDLNDRCDDIVNATNLGSNNDAQVTAGLLGMANDETFAQGETSIELGGQQLTNVSARMAALRQGASGVSLTGLFIDQGGRLVSADDLAARNGGKRGGAAGDMGGRWGAFVNGTIGTGDKDPTARELGFDHDSVGVTAGVDYKLSPQSVVGVAVGYASNEADLDNAAGDVEADSYSISLYGSFFPSDQVYVDGVVGYGRTDFDQTRNINYTASGTTVNQVASSSTDSDNLSFSVEGGYNMSSGGWTYGPYARLAYMNVDVDAYDETMSNPAAPGSGLGLHVNSQEFDSLTTNIGFQASFANSTSWGVFVPYARAEWVHEFKNDDNRITGNFLGDAGGATVAIQQFSITPDDPDENYFVVGLGATAVMAQGRTLFVGYQGLFGYSDLSSHAFTAGARFEF